MKKRECQLSGCSKEATMFTEDKERIAVCQKHFYQLEKIKVENKDVFSKLFGNNVGRFTKEELE